uniref:uncharacterized protein LOC117610912 n=1 Tax=Osmia lignaria TaxID=473952 RepID=UPI0014787DCB|nr:uncharacterized protein LOC117610912 [Osmia lignaria]
MMTTSVARIETLTRDNYDTWKMQMRALLIKNDAWTYVSGESEMPERKKNNEASEAAYKAWKRNDEKAKSDIILSISASELKQVKSCETSHEMWRRLGEIYQSRGPAKKATLLKRLLLHKMKEEEDIHTHLV